MWTEILRRDASEDNAANIWGMENIEWMLYCSGRLTIVFGPLRGGDARRGVVATGPRTGATLTLSYAGVWRLAEEGRNEMYQAYTWSGIASAMDNAYGRI